MESIHQSDYDTYANMKRLGRGSISTNDNNKTMETDIKASRISNMIRKSISTNNLNYSGSFVSFGNQVKLI